jgi:hypothetical protein
MTPTKKAMPALADAVSKVVEDHRRQARPLAAWRDGKAVWISATEAGAIEWTNATWNPVRGCTNTTFAKRKTPLP